MQNVKRAGPKALPVQIYIPYIQNVARSVERGRNLIYILFRGQSPEGLASGRLPRSVSDDSYYEYWVGDVDDQDADWINHDQAPVGRPIIWTGTLALGQSAEFVVMLMEQDNDGIGTLDQALETGPAVAELVFAGDTAAQNLIAAEELAMLLPLRQQDELIGAFTIQVCNVQGTLQSTFIPIQGQTIPSSASNLTEAIAQREQAQTALFDCMGGSGGHCRVIPAARIGPALPIRTYNGKAIDRCGESLLAVEGGPGTYSGFYHVGKGKAAWIPVAAPRFAWYCQTSKAWTTAPDGTNLVHAHRSAGADRQIVWYCYAEQGVRPAYKPNRTWVKLSAEIDRCDEGLLAVEGVGGFYQLATGQQRMIPLPDRQFRWYSGGNVASAIASEETNLVLAKRSAQARQITWEYCREIVSLQPYTRPDDPGMFLARASEPCD